MSNPLLSTAALPAFASIKPEHIQPAITELLAQAQAAQAKVTDPDFPADLHAMERELDVATDARTRRGRQVERRALLAP